MPLDHLNVWDIGFFGNPAPRDLSKFWQFDHLLFSLFYLLLLRLLVLPYAPLSIRWVQTQFRLKKVTMGKISSFVDLMQQTRVILEDYQPLFG